MEKLVEQVAIGRVDLYAIGTSLNCILGGLNIVLDVFLNFINGKGLGNRCVRVVGALGDIRGTDIRETTGIQIGLESSSTESPELDIDIGLVGMNGVKNLLPGINLVLSPNTRSKGVTRSGFRDEGSFSDDESTRTRRSLGVVKGMKISNSVVGGSHSGKRSHGDTVLEVHATNLDVLKKIHRHYAVEDVFKRNN